LIVLEYKNTKLNVNYYNALFGHRDLT